MTVEPFVSQPTSTLIRRSPVAAPARIPSKALLGANREVVILHGGREYRLRLTRNGKLILTA